MKNDPIIQEVREAGEELAKRAGFNLHSFIEQLRESEKNAKLLIASTTGSSTEQPSPTKQQ
ncbi:MAG: hypothetical protein AB9903_06685 [Vulcanimicrobiota bacterium]